MDADELPNDCASELARLQEAFAAKEAEAKVAKDAVAHYRKELHEERDASAKLVGQLRSEIEELRSEVAELKRVSGSSRHETAQDAPWQADLHANPDASAPSFCRLEQDVRFDQGATLPKTCSRGAGRGLDMVRPAWMQKTSSPEPSLGAGPYPSAEPPKHEPHDGESEAQLASGTFSPCSTSLPIGSSEQAAVASSGDEAGTTVTSSPLSSESPQRIWQAFRDPESGKTWWYDEVTAEFTWESPH